MNLNPIDIRHQEFAKSFRGCDPEEVEQYLNQVADSLEEVLHESERLKGDIRELKAKLESYTGVENAISETMVSARQTAEKTIENANKELELIHRRATVDAEQIIRQASEKAVATRRDIHDLELKKTSLISELRAILHTHLRLLGDTEPRIDVQLENPQSKSELTDGDVDRIAEEF